MIYTTLIIIGSLFIMLASIGIVRFDSLYSRMHASTKASSFGILLILTGVSVFFNILDVYVKSALIVIFIYISAPLAAHSIAKSYDPTNNIDD